MRTKVLSVCSWWEQGCVQVASGENKGVFRLLRVRTGCVQAASGEREQGCGQAASDRNKGVFRLLRVRIRVCSGCF